MNNVSTYHTDLLTPDTSIFEKQYISIRKKEQRIYTNDEVALLPDISPSHIHHSEWQIRKRSSQRLFNYLRKKNKPLKIAEIGCGNGWLSSKLADINNTTVTGVDINLSELKQAFEIFDHKPNLGFIYGDIDELTCPFDILVFAASIQYFPSLQQTLTTAISLLSPSGEIHILDTPFYKKDELQNAIERTKNYYTRLGHPEMSAHYFHHSFTELKAFEYELLPGENFIINKLLRRKVPFPWIRITRN